MGPACGRPGPAERKEEVRTQPAEGSPAEQAVPRRTVPRWVHSPEGSPARKARAWRAVHSLRAESLTLLARSLHCYPLCPTRARSLRLLVQPVLLLTS